MFRIGRQLKNRCNSYGRTTLRSQKACNVSTSAGSGSGAAKSALIATGLVITSGVATVGLAWQKPEIRKTIELNVSPSHYLFDAILGPLNESKVDPLSGKPKTVDPFDAPLRSVRRSIEDSTPLETKQNEPFKNNDQDLTTEPTVEKPVLTEEQTLDSSQDSVEQPEPKLEETLSPSNAELSEDFLIMKDEPSELDVVETLEQAELPETIIISSEINSEDSKEDFTSELITEDTSTTEDQPLQSSLARSPEEVQESLTKLEEDVLADAAAMATILDEALAACSQRCAEAIESNVEASKAIALHTAILRTAMDDSSGKESKTEEWTDVSKMFEQKSRLQNEAEVAYQQANEELKKLNSIVEQVKKTNNPVVNRSIIEAEENGNAMRKELEESLREVNSKISESQVISQYKDLVETAKEQFRKELLSVMPDVKVEPGWRGLSRKLSQDDLNALIAHAHRRVDQLQRELAEERAISARRMEKAVQMARERWEEQANFESKKKMEILKEEMEIDHDRRAEEARLAFESEMRVQLKRQAAAHSDHLTEMLSLQASQLNAELTEKFNTALGEQQKEFDEHLKNLKDLHENELNDIKDGFQFNLNKALARVAGVETAVDGRAHIDNESRKAQELWLACEALRIALRYGKQGEHVPLQAELNSITQVHGVESAVKEIVSTFPEQAGERGVFTEESLRNSYKQVSKMCRRLSLISETRNTLFAYIISYLKSFLIVRRARNKPPEDLNLESLDTFQILSYANYCIERGDLEQATRFMNQLQGEPRRVAQGWMNEARLLLETRQTVQALSALATAISIAANLET